MSLPLDKSLVRVLIVDDESSIRDMIATTLRDDGWTVDTAENGKVAQEKLNTQSFHIIMSDINMPEMTGMELLEFVKTNHPKVEFIVMTSHATLDSAMKAVKFGAYDYLNKPFEDLSIIPQKMNQVAEKILLRQQNTELLKRLKTAGKELRRLLESTTPLSSVLELGDLRREVIKALPILFDRPDLRAAWWFKENGEWKLSDATPRPEDYASLKSPEEMTAREGLTLHHLKLQYKGAEESQLCFENLKQSLTEVFCHQTEAVFQKVSFHQEILSLANRDGLTRLYNHRYFQERLQQELSQAKRQKSGLSLILLDIDHFKKYNDQHGHPAGDALLQKFAELLSADEAGGQNPGAGKRLTDIVARYGGEEFVMILPFTLHDGALIKAERVRKTISEFPFAEKEKQPLGFVSASIGVATFPDHGDTGSALIQRADRALYEAKARGRNSVVSANEVREMRGPLQLEETALKELLFDAGVDSLPAEPKSEPIKSQVLDSLEKFQPTIGEILESAGSEPKPAASAPQASTPAEEPVLVLDEIAPEASAANSSEVDISALVSAIEKAVTDATEEIPNAQLEILGETESSSAPVPGTPLVAKESTGTVAKEQKNG